MEPRGDIYISETLVIFWTFKNYVYLPQLIYLGLEICYISDKLLKDIVDNKL